VLITSLNDNDGVMVSMLTSSVVDCGFKPLSSHIKDCKIGMCCFSTSFKLVISTYSGYNCNIVESGVKHHNPNPKPNYPKI
jgi:hypothetical protein